MDELIDGNIDGWPCSILLMRNPGERWVGVHAVAYTQGDDESAPDGIARRISKLEGDFKTRRNAMAHVLRHGFKPAGKYTAE